MRTSPQAPSDAPGKTSVTTNVAMVCPSRPDGGRRDELRAFCHAWWAERFPSWRWVDGQSPDGPFNRGAAINAGATAAGEWDVLVIVDGDVVAEPDQVSAAVARAADTGRACFAFTEYRALPKVTTDRVLAGFDGNWGAGAPRRMLNHVSSIVAVPRALWERVEGFDERCDGWGHDDVIFAHTCRVLGGGLERINGTVWHLWHPVSPHRIDGDPGNRAAGLLGGRYYGASTTTEVAALVAERTSESVALIVPTHGRRSCIDESIPAALANLNGLPIGPVVIADDSNDIEYQAWLRWRFPDAELVTHGRRHGFSANAQRAWDAAIATGRRWVFWLEDDFRLTEPVDLAAMASVLDAQPHLTQMVLRRQAWYPAEIAAGGIIEARPNDHHDISDGTHQWVEHQLGHWMNPHLVSRQFLAQHRWPDGRDSEARFGRQAMTGDRRSAWWGARTDPPTVEHFGERTGHGY